MGIFSSVAAAVHNDELQRKAIDLAEAIKAKDWDKAEAVQRWIDSRLSMNTETEFD